MIAGGCFVPEVWFRDIRAERTADEPGSYLCVGFCAGEFAERIAKMPKNEVFKAFLDQLEEMFGQLRERHMSAYNAQTEEEAQAAAPFKHNLPKPSDMFMEGMIYDWVDGHPYIGGGYASPRAGRVGPSGALMSQSVSDRVFFCGEGTNPGAGATAQAAMETGLRAAKQIMATL